MAANNVLPMTWISVAIVLMLSCTVQGAVHKNMTTDPAYYIPRNDPVLPIREKNDLNQTIKYIPRDLPGSVMCYECSSWTHPLCDDPFNFSVPLEKGPPVASCDGCCVKLVQHIGSPYASIRRTCTEKLQINLFVVDHVCMREGSGQGHMCFCNEDLCNAAPSSIRPTLPWATVVLPILLLFHASFFSSSLSPSSASSYLVGEPR